MSHSVLFIILDIMAGLLLVMLLEEKMIIINGFIQEVLITDNRLFQMKTNGIIIA